MDADNQDDPKHLIQICKFILKGYELILTERKLRQHSHIYDCSYIFI